MLYPPILNYIPLLVREGSREYISLLVFRLVLCSSDASVSSATRILSSSLEATGMIR